MSGGSIILITVLIILAFSTLLFVISRYKKCPSDKIMVIYGKVGHSKDGTALSAKCIHGGAAFVWPIFQAYEFLDLKPISINVDLRNALSRQNIRIDVPSSFYRRNFNRARSYAECCRKAFGAETPGNPGTC